MSLFSLAELFGQREGLPEGLHGNRAAADLELRRGARIEVTPNPMHASYYGLIDFEYWLRKYVGRKWSSS